MTIRPYAPEDAAAVRALHRLHGEELWFAVPEDPLSVVTHVAEEDGRIIGCVTARATVEGFLMLDPAWKKPRDRWEMARDLIDSVGEACARIGYSEAHIGVNDIFRGFARRLGKEPHVFTDTRHWLIMALWQRFGKKIEASA